MSFSAGYLIYMAATTIYSIVVAQLARNRALLSDATHFEVLIVVEWHDFWVGSFYDQKKHRVYMFPIPIFGICVDFDANPLDD